MCAYRHAWGSNSCYDNRRALTVLRAAICLSNLILAHSSTGGSFYCLSRQRDRGKKGAERIFQGWKVVHTINSLTFTARNPIFSGRHVFFSPLVCVRKWLFMYQTLRCVIWASLFQALHSCNLDNIILTRLYPAACFVPPTPSNIPSSLFEPPSIFPPHVGGGLRFLHLTNHELIMSWWKHLHCELSALHTIFCHLRAPVPLSELRLHWLCTSTLFMTEPGFLQQNIPSKNIPLKSQLGAV